MSGTYVDDVGAGHGHPPITDRIRSLVEGPNIVVSRRTHMLHHVCHFRVHDLDVKKKRTQDSGVMGVFNQESRASRHDTNVVPGELPYYGRILDIWELEFRGFYETVLYVHWHRTGLAGARATIVQDETGYWRVDTSAMMRHTRAGDEPIVYPRHITQCIFIPSPLHPGWSYGIPYVPRSCQIIQGPDT